MTSFTEENYLKTIYHLSGTENEVVSTSALAEASNTKAASVTDMLRRLSEKKFINYTKYQGVTLTPTGQKIALRIIRRHRIWEVFLVEKLGFKWDEIHEIAEQLEHINSAELINRLDAFLEYPSFDPHGDPIPNTDGKLPELTTTCLTDALEGKLMVVRNVSEDSTVFLQYLNRLQIKIGTLVKITERNKFDHSMFVMVNDNEQVMLSKSVTDNLFVTINNS
ncbi:MAG: DtxR family Mn-dependent transcriptional regulator [Spirosomataceae bacterium]|jgi:DtxR family Mn-dependent transcriptional regulator